MLGSQRKISEEYLKSMKSAKRHFALHPILLFNEADALIGKRINVNSSVDQMNNAMQNISVAVFRRF